MNPVHDPTYGPCKNLGESKSMTPPMDHAIHLFPSPLEAQCMDHLHLLSYVYPTSAGEFVSPSRSFAFFFIRNYRYLAQSKKFEALIPVKCCITVHLSTSIRSCNVRSSPSSYICEQDCTLQSFRGFRTSINQKHI